MIVSCMCAECVCRLCRAGVGQDHVSNWRPAHYLRGQTRRPAAGMCVCVCVCVCVRVKLSVALACSVCAPQ